MSEHTPGPWTVSDKNSYDDFNIRDGDKRVVAQAIHPWTVDNAADEVAANARLIAAAPDLLAALEAVVRDVERVAKNDVIWPATLKQARAAIRKATAERAPRHGGEA